MIEWSFPGNQEGQVKGIADPGIENFNGAELVSMVRENCQNSLDAALDEFAPKVLVEFERYFIKSDRIPGIIKFRNVLQECQKAWDGESGEKAKSFFKEAIQRANEGNNFVLRISDYNTTGLSDPYVKLEEAYNFGNSGGWNSLTKIDGGANKGGSKAGAFGIGKNAPFCNSYYRMVFYRTLNQANERAAQGITRLVSFRDGEKLTNGVGYYGNPDGNIPVESIGELEQLNKRTQVGTDVFVFGFKADSDWETKIKVAVLENFLVSIYNGHLCVKVQNEEINSNSLNGHVERVASKLKEGTYGHYLCLCESELVKRYSKDFHGMGILELRILVDPANNSLDKKVLIVRKAGMKLFRLGGISKVRFTGILELKGERLNSYFRSMETVAHDKWEPNRHPNPRQAKEYFEEIKTWIRDTVASLVEHTSGDEMNVEGLSDVLRQRSEADIERGSNDKREKLGDDPKDIKIIKHTKKSLPKGVIHEAGDEGAGKPVGVKGTLGPDGYPAMRTLKGKKPRKRKDSHKGMPDSNGTDIVFQLEGKSHTALKSVRIIKKSAGTYVVNFELPRNMKYGRMDLVTVGENGKSNPICIKEVDSFDGCEKARLSNGFIEMEGVPATKKIKIVVKMMDTRDYAMEVNVYEYNK